MWELDEEVMNKTLAYQNELVFVVNRFILAPDRLYRFLLTGGLPEGPKGLAQTNGFTNTPPSGGSCGVTPSSGYSLNTIFTFWCKDWKDVDSPLRYEYVSIDATGVESLFYFGIDEKVTGMLPLGIQSRNYQLEMQIRVLDLYNAEAQYTVFVQVSLDCMTQCQMYFKP